MDDDDAVANAQVRVAVEPPMLVNADPANARVLRGEPVGDSVGVCEASAAEPLFVLERSGVSSLAFGVGAFVVETDLGGWALAVRPLATVVFAVTQRLGSLEIAGGTASLLPGQHAVLILDSLASDATEVLDLADSGLILCHADTDHGQAKCTRIERWAPSAMRAGPHAWSGPGLTSSTAAAGGGRTTLAVVDNDKGAGRPLFAKFGSHLIDQSAILVKYTWNGDANSDGVVNADDYFLIDAAYIGQSGSLAARPAVGSEYTAPPPQAAPAARPLAAPPVHKSYPSLPAELFSAKPIL